jgi:hypothetical protein
MASLDTKNHTDSVVAQWLGSHFQELHPLLQNLHSNPSVLSGQVEVSFGRGLAGVIGKRLAAQLGIPGSSGQCPFTVAIYKTEGALHWVRSFNGYSQFHSVFEPFGQYPDGYWVERSGHLRLLLGVEIKSGEWHWLHKHTQFCGIPLPRFLLPVTLASKSIKQERYHFSVEISAPIFGKLLAYSGLLDMVIDSQQQAFLIRNKPNK